MRRRRTKYQWFQGLATLGPAADETDSTLGRSFAINGLANGTTSSIVLPVLPDFQAEDTDVGGPMGYLQNNDYFLKRVVGKIHIGITQAATDSTRNLLVGAGLFVARAAESLIAPDLPIGVPTATSGIVTAEYGPLRDENGMQPWIWRRTWVLANASSTDPTVYPAWPTNNSQYGSVLDGPHIDAKTARHVTREERLWAVISARSFPLNTTTTFGWGLWGMLDLRFLGRMAKTVNRGVF